MDGTVRFVARSYNGVEKLMLDFFIKSATLLTERKNSMKLTIQDYKKLRDELKEWHGINPTVYQMKKILGSNKGFIDCYLEGKKGVDTLVREKMVDIIGMKYAQAKWPINADSRRVSRNFFKKLLSNLKRANIKILVAPEEMYN